MEMDRRRHRSDLALERVLHYRCPEWGESIRETRIATGFSFGMGTDELWAWLGDGGHTRVKGKTEEEVDNLGVPEFYQYYMCCVYSDYERPGSTVNCEEIKGPPWFGFPCPASSIGDHWRDSMVACKAELSKKLGVAPGSPQFLGRLMEHGGIDGLFERGMSQVARLGLDKEYAMLWVCCILPSGAKYLVDRTIYLYEQLPHLADWEQFGAECLERESRRRVRAYPSGVDWTEGKGISEDFPELPKIPGIEYRVLGGEMTLRVDWNPLIATSEADIISAVKSLNRYYQNRLKKRHLKRASGLLPGLSSKRRKGGRPPGGAARDAIALECAMLKDEHEWTYRRIADKFDFPIQQDSYGRRNRSIQARRMVKRGRELLEQQKQL